MILLIRIICEYDISGSLGGNNNEEILQVFTDDPEEITKLVESYVKSKTSLSSEDLEDCLDWEWFELKSLGEKCDG